jgi:menaquinone-9 beta-reductase
MVDYDLIIIGGGLAGCAFATVMSERGASVLVVERERQFRDRVRGESMHPWGITEARALGIYEHLLKTCAHEIRWWESHPAPPGEERPRRRDLPATNPHHAGELALYHPAMQEAMVHSAEAAGAEVLRETALVMVTPSGNGVRPRVVIQQGAMNRTLTARLVVGADGRRSLVRQQLGFPIERDPANLRITGALLTGMPIDHEVVRTFRPATFGSRVLLFPLRDERVRLYFITGRRTAHAMLSGARDLWRLVEYCVEAGVPREWLADVQLVGPLATFEGADCWVEHPYREEVVLIGDAAGATDPAWGCGLSLTLRDVRVLRDELAGQDDWDRAAHRYADAHHRSFAALHTAESWMAVINYDLGPEADRVRQRALLELAAGRGPDFAGLGPESPVDADTQVALFGS